MPLTMNVLLFVMLNHTSLCLSLYNCTYQYNIKDWTDFVWFIAAYGIGLLITFVMLFVMQQGQPALLYLVPCTLITGYVIGWLRGDLKRLWTGRMV